MTAKLKTRRLSTVLSLVYNSEHYRPDAPFLSIPNSSQFLCNALRDAEESGLISFDERLHARHAIMQLITPHDTLRNYMKDILGQCLETGTEEYKRAAMKFWREWRKDLRLQGL